MMDLCTAEGRKKPGTDKDRRAAFRSMVAYGGSYRVEGDKLTVISMWQPNPNLPGNPETRAVLVWSRVKGPQ